MSLRIIKPGFFATLQDVGRYGYQALGVPVSGAMDEEALTHVNLLVGNREDACAIEFTLHGAEVLVEEDVVIALSGGGSHVFYKGQELPFGKAIHLRKGFAMKFGLSLQGCRTYLAVAGGLDVTKTLNSVATYTPASLGGLNGNVLKAGDRISVSKKLSPMSLKIQSELALGSADWCISKWGFARSVLNRHVRIVHGPEWHWFTPETQRAIFESEFNVLPTSNRTGYRMQGKSLQRNDARELVSTSVAKGTIQGTPDGRIILLMADCQTTGGYPRIGFVAAVDLSVCAQLKIGDSVRFSSVSFDEAERLLLERQRTTREMKFGLSTRFGL